MGHGHSSFEARKGAHLRMTRDRVGVSIRSNVISYTPKYACLMVSLLIMSAELPEARMLPASSR